MKRLVHPLTGSTTWVEFDGTSVTRKVWDGRANLEGFETNSAAGGHIEASARGESFSANLSLTTRGNRQIVSIRPQGTSITEVSLTLDRR